jgi:hypothetical protein
MRHPQAESKEKTGGNEWFSHELLPTRTGVDPEVMGRAEEH